MTKKIHQSNVVSHHEKAFQILCIIEIMDKPTPLKISKEACIPIRTINYILARVNKNYGVEISRVRMSRKEGIYYQIQNWGYLNKEKIKNYYKLNPLIEKSVNSQNEINFNS